MNNPAWHRQVSVTRYDHAALIAVGRLVYIIKQKEALVITLCSSLSAEVVCYYAAEISTTDTGLVPLFIRRRNRGTSKLEGQSGERMASQRHDLSLLERRDSHVLFSSAKA